MIVTHGRGILPGLRTGAGHTIRRCPPIDLLLYLSHRRRYLLSDALRQRCTSRAACCSSPPILTGLLTFMYAVKVEVCLHACARSSVTPLGKIWTHLFRYLCMGRCCSEVFLANMRNDVTRETLVLWLRENLGVFPAAITMIAQAGHRSCYACANLFAPPGPAPRMLPALFLYRYMCCASLPWCTAVSTVLVCLAPDAGGSGVAARLQLQGPVHASSKIRNLHGLQVLL